MATTVMPEQPSTRAPLRSANSFDIAAQLPSFDDIQNRRAAFRTSLRLTDDSSALVETKFSSPDYNNTWLTLVHSRNKQNMVDVTHFPLEALHRLKDEQTEVVAAWLTHCNIVRFLGTRMECDILTAIVHCQMEAILRLLRKEPLPIMLPPDSSGERDVMHIHSHLHWRQRKLMDGDDERNDSSIRTEWMNGSWHIFINHARNGRPGYAADIPLTLHVMNFALDVEARIVETLHTKAWRLLREHCSMENVRSSILNEEMYLISQESK